MQRNSMQNRKNINYEICTQWLHEQKNTRKHKINTRSQDPKVHKEIPNTDA